MAEKVTQETLLSSVYSNGYVADESSSFNKSDNEYSAGSLSDSDCMSPTSRHSWDYVNKYGSPYSSSSFSRKSCSPGSSVCREARKRLSERWAMVASNENSHQKHVRKRSSTLGEMLGLFDTKKYIASDDDSGDKEEDTCGLSSRSASDYHASGSGEPQKNLSRSKALPVSGVRVNEEGSDPETNETQNSMEVMKSKSTKSSHKGEFSGIFFLRSKRTSKEEHVTECKDDFLCRTVETARSPVHSAGKTIDANKEFVNHKGHEEGKSSYICHCCSSSATFPELSGIRHNCEMVPQESQLSVSKVTCGSTSEKSDQPSPISEPPFEEEENAIPDSPGSVKAQNLESVSYTLKPSLPMKGLVNREDWFFLVQTLLILASLDGEMLDSSLFVRWNSHESPLDRLLREKDVNLWDKETLHEGKQSKARSNWKLVFDCVNTALVEISEHELDKSIRGRRCGEAHSKLVDGRSLELVDCVWARMKKWFSDEGMCLPVDDGSVSGLVLERAVSKEVVRGGWFVQMRLEVDTLGKDIMGKLLEELVEETVIDLTGTLG